MSRIAPRKPIINRRPQPAASVPRKPGQPSTGGRVGTNAKGTEDGYLYVAGVKDPSKRVSEFRVSLNSGLSAKVDGVKPLGFRQKEMCARSVIRIGNSTRISDCSSHHAITRCANPV